MRCAAARLIAKAGPPGIPRTPPCRYDDRSAFETGRERVNNVRAYRGVLPKLGARVYIDPAATVIGDVELGDDVSIWPATVLRGDVEKIRIGARSNVQDGAVLHVTHDGPYTPGGQPCLIGADVTIGHGAVVHACTVGDCCLIGMHATILDGAVVQRHAFVGAGALVAPGKTVGEGELWIGNPARCVRKLSEGEIEALRYSAAHYVKLKDEYLAALL
jgi:carbonic anhydrase/acetyltransferase-like protein (isoleucine patch superfamily)